MQPFWRSARITCQTAQWTIWTKFAAQAHQAMEMTQAPCRLEPRLRQPKEFRIGALP